METVKKGFRMAFKTVFTIGVSLLAIMNLGFLLVLYLYESSGYGIFF